MTKTREAAGSWGCLSCRRTVRESLAGRCTVCGGRIGRVVPVGSAREVAIVPPPLSRAVQQRAAKGRNILAIIAGAGLCIGSPWHAAVIVWGLSLSCYGLARVRARAHPIPG
jgi:hypothetical protein